MEDIHVNTAQLLHLGMPYSRVFIQNSLDSSFDSSVLIYYLLAIRYLQGYVALNILNKLQGTNHSGGTSRR